MDEKDPNLEEDYTKLEELFTKILTPAFSEVIKDQTKEMEVLLERKTSAFQSYAEAPIDRLDLEIQKQHETVIRLLVEHRTGIRKQGWLMVMLHSIITVIALGLLKYIF